VPVIDSAFVEPGGDAGGFPDHAEFVVKPAIGAGARDTQRYTRAERAAAVAHVQRLLDAGRSVLVQPYLDQVDASGETALIFFDGVFSHAIRKGPLLARGEGPTQALFATEDIVAREPGTAEFDVAHRALEAIPFARLAYARVDLLPSPDGPRLLELELTEPSLFFAHGAVRADPLGAVLLAMLVGRKARTAEPPIPGLGAGRHCPGSFGPLGPPTAPVGVGRPRAPRYKSPSFPGPAHRAGPSPQGPSPA
jgi:O-ureido-D-serine cyclo-ligase